MKDFFIGSDAGTKARNDLNSQITNNLLNRDNRMADFENYSGTALNNLANRGIINSSVTSGAMANALNQADQNYINTQLQAYGLLANNMPQDTVGLLPNVVGSFAGGFGTGLGKSFLGGF